MATDSLDDLMNAEFKEAFDEFDKVREQMLFYIKKYLWTVFHFSSGRVSSFPYRMNKNHTEVQNTQIFSDEVNILGREWIYLDERAAECDAFHGSEPYRR